MSRPAARPALGVWPTKLLTYLVRRGPWEGTPAEFGAQLGMGEYATFHGLAKLLELGLIQRRPIGICATPQGRARLRRTVR